MKKYIKHDEWRIIEDGFVADNNEISESIFSIGNGRMGQRANFEEDYTGKTLCGNYVAGVYYPDKTKVGWWKNGYPEYFAKVLNAANWIGIHIEIDGKPLDLNTCEVTGFRRILHMKEGYLERTFTAKMENGKMLSVKSLRFCSIANDEIGAIRYAITPLNFSGSLTITPYIDGDVRNRDANWDEKFWSEVKVKVKKRQAYVLSETKKTGFQVCTGMRFTIFQNGEELALDPQKVEHENYGACSVEVKAGEKDEVVVYKYAAVVSSLNYSKEELMKKCQSAVKRAAVKGFDLLLDEQTSAWHHKWADSDIIIEGDIAAQQAIRFNIFQLNQTYTGEDERLNIGPKGFTGEKYGGSTYWDTEAYCLPFYMSTALPFVARNLLIYRYKHLQKAIENAQKLGFKDGAALYPMVTTNGEECHNEWEITFEEIHRNGAIAFAIFDYIRYTGDEFYLAEYGLEVLIGIARFWAQRIHFSEKKQKYVMHGVTGPNEYENNVNNNWYTNYIACWCMEYAQQAADYVAETNAKQYAEIVRKTKFDYIKETTKWQEIRTNMYFPYDESLGIFLQQDDYLDKEQILVKDLDKKHLPLNQKWSWDRILRSCFIKQADVLQGLYFFEDRFSKEDIRRNFEFYEPRTVHESSLSPCVHVILAALVGDKPKAYEMYLRTARLDLDNYNNDTEDGLHITSMAGTWLSVIKGFGGMRVRNDKLYFSPFLPERWRRLAFKVMFRSATLQVSVTKQGVNIHNLSEKPISVVIFGEEKVIKNKAHLAVAYV